MKRMKKCIWMLGILLSLLFIEFSQNVTAVAETQNVMSEETQGQEETLEDNEIPLAAAPTNTVAFMWCGIAMVTALASITGYFSFGKAKVVNKE